MRYVQEIAPGLQATPQVVLLMREADTYHMLLRWVGVARMQRWVRAGMPLPYGES
ncbi:hypothetical protein [Rhodothermus profundi]|uniref:hypothetical protein n=1 Tax=Rhodothermus profundi TaxID=633813 RepID=UPI0015BD7354|nr:hypothetical protein [Rhodothermus profundi]